MSQGRLLPAASTGMEPAPLLEPVQYINNDQFDIIMKYDVHDKKKNLKIKFTSYLSHKFSLLFLEHTVESFTSQSGHVRSTFHSSHEGSDGVQRSHGTYTQLHTKRTLQLEKNLQSDNSDFRWKNSRFQISRSEAFSLICIIFQGL